ncbi:glutaredoxin family protein [Methylovulum psychrotolerans]|uniref:Glutaredoxin family protein n=1 Tax=Methylovulum psychrotolerans TaxID=1704499 RepID=A0A2S5CHA5_9GAMM|nr:glutaredoxin family protein [Methylovulum psychrotolerans]POZ50112.1 glutaredoxin family protein [Methylovulum psychrotolerans]
MKTSTFLALATITGGLIQNHDKISAWLDPLPAITRQTGQNEVILYSTTWCGYCAKTRKYFAEHHIKYTDLDIEHSEQGRSGYNQLHGHGVPIVVINGVPIYGYDPGEMGKALANKGGA